MKRNGDTQRPAVNRAQPPPKTHFDPVALATLAGVVAVVAISFSSMRDIARLERTFGDRLARLETQVSQVGTRAPQQAQQGPDPARVYTVDTAKAVAKGPAAAPITIVEFSEFQ